MDWIEIEGETREEVESKALEALKTGDINNVEIEELKVVRKFMGMGGKTIKIRARMKEEPSHEDQAGPVTDERTDDGAESDAVTGLVEPASEPETAKKEKVPESKPPEANDEMTTFESLYRPWVKKGPGGVYLSNKGKGYGGKLYNLKPLSDDNAQEVKRKSRKPDADGNRVQPRVEVEQEEFIPTVYKEDEDSTITQDAKQMAMDFVEKTVTSMGLGGQITGYRLEDRLLIQIDSESAGLLIGHRGETLEALQYLTDIIVNRHLEQRIRIILDTENYRDKRKHKICQMAKIAASDATLSRKSVALSPMNAGERRLIHTSLASDSKVKTMSEGDGSRRRVVVHPVGVKKNNSKPKGGQRKRTW